MKRIRFILLILILLISMVIPLNGFAAGTSVKISIEGKLIEFNESVGYPFIDTNGRTQVPFRVTLERFGAIVKWDQDTKTAIAEKNGIKVEIPIGQKYIFRNGQKIESDTFALLKNNKTYLPIRAVIEALGGIVDWDNTSKTVSIKEEPVFKGYFKNPDYSDPTRFMQTGIQTKATQKVKEAASKVNNLKDISTLKDIFKIVHNVPQIKDGIRQTATAEQVLEEGSNGCTRNAILFAAIAREKGIPSVVVNTAYINWIKDIQADPAHRMTEGHFFVEVFLADEKWYLVDSTSGRLFLNYDKENFSIRSGNRDYYVYAKSLEVIDSGISTDNQIGLVQKQCFLDFDINKYKNPQYQEIALD